MPTAHIFPSVTALLRSLGPSLRVSARAANAAVFDVDGTLVDARGSALHAGATLWHLAKALGLERRVVTSRNTDSTAFTWQQVRASMRDWGWQGEVSCLPWSSLKKVSVSEWKQSRRRSSRGALAMSVGNMWHDVVDTHTPSGARLARKLDKYSRRGHIVAIRGGDASWAIKLPESGLVAS